MKVKIVLFSLILCVAVAPAAFATYGAGELPPRQNTVACADAEAQVGEAVAEERFVVKNPQGTELGEIVNFLVDTEVDKVAYALLDTGGSMSMEDIRLVPVSALRVEYQEIVLNMDEEALANAPTPQPGQEPEEFHRRISEYYGVAPYWEE